MIAPCRVLLEKERERERDIVISNFFPLYSHVCKWHIRPGVEDHQTAHACILPLRTGGIAIGLVYIYGG